MTSNCSGSELTPQRPILISYSDADRAKVAPLASFVGHLGLCVWLETEDAVAATLLVEAMRRPIGQGQIYVACVSPRSIASARLDEELRTALSLEAATGQPNVLPVMVELTLLPSQLADRPYIDATNSLDAAREPLRTALAKIVGDEHVGSVRAAIPTTRLSLASAHLTLFEDTDRLYGGPHAAHTSEQVREEAFTRLASLRRKANGILLNFIPAQEFDWTNPPFTFPNGTISERVEEIAGPFTGAIANRAIVDVDVINPDEDSLAALVSAELALSNVLRLGYQFVFAPADNDLPSQALARLQSTYPIVSWDSISGAEVALPNDLRAKVRVTAEDLSVIIEGRRYLFEARAKDFSAREFVDWLRE